VLLIAALAVTGAGVFVVHERLERDPLAGVPPAARAELAVRAAEASAAKGAFAEAEASLLEATTLYEAAAAAEPGTIGPDRGRLAALDRLGQGAVRQGKTTDALTYAKRALDLAVDVLGRLPGDERAALDALATAHTYADRAERARVAAADVRRALVAAAEAVSRAGTPGIAVAPALARTWMRVARLKGDAATVSAAWQEAVTAAERVPPDADVIAVLTAAAEAAPPPHAEAAHARALAAAARFAAARPDDPAAHRLHEARLVGAAEAAEAAGRPGDAAPWLTEVVASRRTRLQKAHPADAAEVRRELARALSNLGAHHASQGDDTAAAVAYTEAVALSADLQGPARRTHLIALGNLAELESRTASPAAARVTAGKAATLAAELADAPRAGLPEALDRAAAELRLARLVRASGTDRARALARAALTRLDAALATPGAGAADARSTELRAALAELADLPSTPGSPP
jgi:hypothetical protein